MIRLLRCFLLILYICPAFAQTPPNIRAELAVLLIEAQDALKIKNPSLAFEKITTANALKNLNSDEITILNRLRVAVGIDGGQPILAINALNALIAAPEVPVTEKPLLLELLVSLLQKQKSYQQVLEATKIYSTLAAPKRSILLANAQAHYFLKNYDIAITQINTLIPQPSILLDLSIKEVPAPEEYLLRMLADSHQQLKNRAGYIDSLALLLAYYPNPSYWSDYIARHINQLEAGSPYELDWYRLMRATQNLQESEDYMTYAQVALKAGLPQEAMLVHELGVKSGLLGTTKNKSVSDALRIQIVRRATEDIGSLEQLERQVGNAVNGNMAAQIGDLNMASGRWAQAHTAYLKAIEKGSLRREESVRLHSGIALALQNQQAAAIEAFAWNGFGPSTRPLTVAWTLWLKKPLK